jgi:ferredoxin-NADP reductase
LAVDFDAPRRLDMQAIEEPGVPRDADFYLCGPSAFMNDLAVELGNWGVAANRIDTEIFGSSSPT